MRGNDIHIYLIKLLFISSVIFSILLNAGCMTSALIEDATKGKIKNDYFDVDSAYEKDNNLIINVNNYTNRDLKYTIKISNDWYTQYSSEYYKIKRSKIYDGHTIPPENWSKLILSDKLYQASTNPIECYLFNNRGSGTIELWYLCHNEKSEYAKSVKRFILENDYYPPPLYELLFVPLTLPLDIATFPFQLMLMKAGSNIH